MDILSLDWTPLWLSLRVSLFATALATAGGILAAYLLAEYRFPGRNLLEALTSLPLILPPTVLGYYLLTIMGRETILGGWIEAVFGQPLVFTWQGAVIAAAIPSLPFVVRTARAAFEEVGAEVREASRIDGASRLQHFALVLLPLAQRGVAAGVALAFARSLGEFGTTLMVAGNIPGRTQTMPLAIYDAVQAGDLTRAGVMAALLTVVAAAVLWAVGRLGGIRG